MGIGSQWLHLRLLVRVRFPDRPPDGHPEGNPEGKVGNAFVGAVVMGMLREVEIGRARVEVGSSSEMAIGRVRSRGMVAWGAGAACVKVRRKGSRVRRGVRVSMMKVSRSAA